jgi:hypothetical protein
MKHRGSKIILPLHRLLSSHARPLRHANGRARTTHPKTDKRTEKNLPITTSFSSIFDAPKNSCCQNPSHNFGIFPIQRSTQPFRTMKTSLFLAFLASVGAFQAPLPVKQSATSLAMAGKAKSKKQNPMEQLLKNLANNFKPIHGHGSLENDLDEQWEAQQEILKNRRSHHIDKDYLMKKYSDPQKVKFDGKVGDDRESSFGKNLSP